MIETSGGSILTVAVLAVEAVVLLCACIALMRPTGGETISRKPSAFFAFAGFVLILGGSAIVMGAVFMSTAAPGTSTVNLDLLSGRICGTIIGVGMSLAGCNWFAAGLGR